MGAPGSFAVILLSLSLLAGCDEISSRDDPRDHPGYRAPPDAGPPPVDAQPSGRCSGSAVFCEDRTLAQCEGGGCAVEDACHSPSLEDCLASEDAESCEANSGCLWSVDQCISSSTCSINDTRTSCVEDSYNDCEWGPVCGGYRDSCYSIEDPDACEANLGCTWERD